MKIWEKENEPLEKKNGSGKKDADKAKPDKESPKTVSLPF